MSTETEEKFGLEYDCPPFQGLSQYVSLVAGASIDAASALTRDENIDIAINWDGGRHHAKKSAAAGFCYVADAVLAIQKLRESFENVVYIDLDIHHGDGVEAAFLYSEKVLTISLHRYDIGFFPGTGQFEACGKGRGKGYALNIPLLQGLSDSSLLDLVKNVVNPAILAYESKTGNVALVVQCGVDGLAYDPLRQWNLSIDGYAAAVAAIQDQANTLKSKVLYLGGGGYDRTLVSRCYAALTAKLIGVDLSNIIPEHECWSEYASSVHELSPFTRRCGVLDQNISSLASFKEKFRQHISTYFA